MWYESKGLFSNNYSTDLANYPTGCLIGFKELSTGSSLDIGKICYKYRDMWSYRQGMRTINVPELWVIVDQDTPYAEIGYAEFSQNGEKFYFNGGLNNFHQGDKGNYLINGNEKWIISPTDGIPQYYKLDDNSFIGESGWQMWEKSTFPTFLSSFSQSNALCQDYTVKMIPYPVLSVDESLSDSFPTLKFHYDFLYNLSVGTEGQYIGPCGWYGQCFTDNASNSVGGNTYTGTNDGISATLYEGALHSPSDHVHSRYYLNLNDDSFGQIYWNPALGKYYQKIEVEALDVIVEFEITSISRKQSIGLKITTTVGGNTPIVRNMTLAYIGLTNPMKSISGFKTGWDRINHHLNRHNKDRYYYMGDQFVVLENTY